tara:strand:- start:185 stop:778 length:594 start_codon:yes stop_codon:yes gene_type:complete
MDIKKEYILYFVIFLLSFALLRRCDSSKKTKVEIREVEKIVVDTTFVRVKGKSDTIHDTIVQHHTQIIPYHIHDTVIVEGDSLSIYVTEIEDSLIKGRFKSLINGKMINSDFTYVPKFPKYITRVDTFKIKIDKETTVVKDPWEFYLGGVVGGNNAKFTLQPAAIIRVPKKGFMFGYGYDLLQETHNVHLYTRIKWR